MTEIIPIGSDYTARDKPGYLERAIRAAKSVFPTWTAAEQADFTRLYLENGATIGGYISKYQEANFRESHLVTCTRRVNAVRHARRLDFPPRRRSAAQADLRFTLTEAAVGRVSFQPTWIVRTRDSQNPLPFQLLTALSLSPGTVEGTVTAENSETRPERFEPTNAPSQQFPLSYYPLIGIETIEDAVGPFTEVTSFRDSGPDDAHYRLLLDNEAKGILEFGDGAKGRLPVVELNLTEKIGGGEVLVGPGQITVPDFTLTDSLGNPVLFSVTNDEKSSGGLNESTVEEIKEQAPASIRTGRTTVAHEDWTINPERVDGIERAMIITSDQMPAGQVAWSVVLMTPEALEQFPELVPPGTTNPFEDFQIPVGFEELGGYPLYWSTGAFENYGQLYLVARGERFYEDGPFAPAQPTLAQKAAVRTMVLETYPKTITFRFDEIGYLPKTVDITARVKLAAGSVESTVLENIKRNLWDFFAVANADGTRNEQVMFGFEYRDADGYIDPYMAWSDLFNAVRDAAGVRSLDRDTFLPVDDVPIEFNQFPELGSVTVINADTGLELGA